LAHEGKLNFLMEYEGAELLKKYHLPVAKSQLAASKEQAIEIAESIGYPVVLKGMSRDIVHKTEAGVVKLNISNAVELTKAYDEIIKNALHYNSEAELAGILVQQMAPKGIELIFGIKKDPVFGHQLIIGFGGTLVEIMKDFTMRMMPVSEQDIEEMLKELKSYPILKGYRNQAGVNIDLIKKICFGLNELVEDYPNIEEIDLNPVIFANNNAIIADVRILMGNYVQVKPDPVIPSLDNVNNLLNPRSIAVVGASQNEKKNGGRLFRFIVENGYNGELYPINPRAEEIRGYKAYPSIKDVPGEVELACIIVDAKLVPKIMEECVEKGVKAAIIYSSGFAEVGDEGKQLQKQVLAIAKKGNICVLGPNSIGLASPGKKIYAAFGNALESKVKIPGKIGFASQSGAMGSALLSRAWEQGAGFSRWISVGNEMDLTTSDFIGILAEDEETKAIAVFMEGIKNAETFKNSMKKALQKKKPVVIFKTGRSSIGKKAVQSHTGSIAGDDQVYSTAFKKYGALRVYKLEDLIDIPRAFTVQPLPKGNRIGIVTASGGACSVIADLCSERGLEVPELKESASEIMKVIPPFGSAQNPVDVTAEIIANPEMFRKVLEIVLNDENIDGVIVMLTTNADPGAKIIAQSILDVFKKSTKPIVVGRLGANMIAPEAMALYEKANFPVYPTPEKVVNVMDYLVKYSRILQAFSEREC